MEILFKSAAVGLIATVIVILLRKNQPEISLLVSVAASAVILIISSSALRSVIRLISETTDSSGIDPAMMTILLKTVAVSVVARFASDICRDGGHASAASAVDLCGAVTSLYISLPLIESVIGTVEEIL